MTDKHKLELVSLLLHAMDQTIVGDLFHGQEKEDIVKMLEGLREEFDTKVFQVGEKVMFLLYDERVRATVVKLGKVRVGIQIAHFPEEIKYVTPKKLKKVKV